MRVCARALVFACACVRVSGPEAGRALVSGAEWLKSIQAKQSGKAGSMRSWCTYLYARALARVRACASPKCGQAGRPTGVAGVAGGSLTASDRPRRRHAPARGSEQQVYCERPAMADGFDRPRGLLPRLLCDRQRIGDRARLAAALVGFPPKRVRGAQARDHAMPCNMCRVRVRHVCGGRGCGVSTAWKRA